MDAPRIGGCGRPSGGWSLVRPSCRSRRRDAYRIRNAAGAGCHVCLRLTYTSQTFSQSDRMQNQAESLYNTAEFLRMVQLDGLGSRKVQLRVRGLLMSASAYEDACMHDWLSRVRLPRPDDDLGQERVRFDSVVVQDGLSRVRVSASGR